MYRRRGRTDFELAVKKFMEHNRDPGRRLKSLKHAEEKATQSSDVKQLYSKYSSAIFFVFYTYFGSLEAAILDRANKGRGYSEIHLKELREIAVPALEHILIYLPELVHRRWQYNAICLIIRKLLHPDNTLKLRKDGIRLLTLWLHALQSNAGDASMQLFASAVPHFPPNKTPMGLPSSLTPSPSSSSSLHHHLHTSTHSLVERYGTYTSRDGAGLLSTARRASSASVSGVREVVKVASLQPLNRSSYTMTVTAADHDITIQLIHHLMDCLTEQVGYLHWEEPAQHLHGFAFLFFLFKLFYLACLYKKFRTEAGLYSQPPPPEIKVIFELQDKCAMLDSLQEESVLDHGIRSSPSSSATPSCEPSPSLHHKRPQRSSGYRMSQVIKLEYDLSNPIYDKIKLVILQRVLSWLQPDKGPIGPLRSPLPSPSLVPSSPVKSIPSFLPSGPELMSEMWFTSRDNVNLLCEICRQSFLGGGGGRLGFSEPQLIRQVIDLYWGWVGGGVYGGSVEQPPFMLEPGASGGSGGSDGHLSVPSGAAPPSSSLSPWEVIINYEGHDSSHVSAGLQPSLRMMIRHTSHVFLLPEREVTHNHQLMLCRKILKFYQDLVMTWSLDHESWEYLLSILLHITLELFRAGPPSGKDNSLAASLAALPGSSLPHSPSLLQTLLICYLRASMVTNVSGKLWDNLSTVLASLTHWKQVIEHWKSVMDTMTHILAQTVYGLDLKDLPLQRLLKEESMIGRRIRAPSSNQTDFATTNLSAFSDIKASTSISSATRLNRSAEERRSLGMKNKSMTVDVPLQPPDHHQTRSRRYSSIPAEGGDPYSLQVNAATQGGGRKKERSISEVKVGNRQGVDVPTRSSSSEGQYRTITEGNEEEEEEKEEEFGIVSPAVSLPSPTTVDRSMSRPLERSEKVQEDIVDSGSGNQLEKSGLTISNQRVRTPTPELEQVQSPGIVFERGGSVEPLIENQDTSDFKPKEKTRRSLFGRGRNKSESGEGGKSWRKLAAKQERDLVFTNECSEDSNTLLDDVQQKSPLDIDKRTLLAETIPPSSPLVASWTAGVGEKRRGLSLTDGAIESEGVRKNNRGIVHARVYKSSSEGNIHRLSLLGEIEGEGEDDEEGSEGCEDSKSIVGTSVASGSRRGSEQMRLMKKNRILEFSPQDAFSSAIIPSSQACLLGSPVGPRSQSPILPSLSPVNSVLSSPRSNPRSQLIMRRGTDSNGRSDDKTEEGEGTGDFEGSGDVEFPSTPSKHHHQQTPSPPIISPSSPSHTQGGWTEVVGAVVWQRILRILGDVNKIPDPVMHHLAFQTLLNVWRRLVELDANLGVSTDNQTTPPIPPYLPPMLILLPWVLRACHLPSVYLEGRTVAVQLMCEMNIRHIRKPLPLEQLTIFYHILQQSLQPTSDTLYVAVKHCSKLFSYGLLGAGVLMTDCITACTTILTSKAKGSDVPRTESLNLLGSMLFLPHLTSDLRNRLISTLFTAACTEPTKNTRCMAIYLVGMMVFSELHIGHPSTYVSHALNILLASLTFSERTVSMTAIDCLTLLTEVATSMYTSSSKMPATVLQGICHAITQFMTHTELKKISWGNKVLVTLLLCLRDWLMILPLQQMIRDSHLPYALLQDTFKVLHAAATSCEQAQLASDSIKVQTTTVRLEPLDNVTANNTFPLGSTRGPKSARRPRGEEVSETPHHPATLRPFNKEDKEKVQVAARSVLTHLINLVGHFPFASGPAQMTSIVSEFHDAPSLRHLDDLSTEIFDSPRVQVFSFNDTAVVTLAEIPIEHTGLPPTVEHSKYHTRIIVRDITGKYAWDCAMLYGPQMFPNTDGIPLITAGDSEEESLTPSQPTESTSLDGGGRVMGVVSSSVDPPPVPFNDNPLQPPSWKTHANSDRDILEDLLKHIESTSPECLLYPGVAGLAEPWPVSSKAMQSLEDEMATVVERQRTAETEYAQNTSTQYSMCGEKETAPTYISVEFAYHHCRVLLSHLGMFSASRRDHVDLLERNNQLILELKHLDSTPAQSRMTYKVAVLYVAPGQEDKRSILSNSSGSQDFEDFVAGMGWEVDMETHAGYMGGLQRDFCTHTTLPYYATSSEEILFHVSTRMPSKGLDVERKVRHLGNDEVHIVWSEHWRDYRRTIFKTHFADILIVIYPLPNRLFRIQIIKKQKQNIPLFGPLFDGAVVNRKNLPSLVRATAINALRAQRSPLVGYRGRYEERLKYIHTIVQRKMKSSFEEFAQNIIHPLESVSLPSTGRVLARNQTPELETLPLPSQRHFSRTASSDSSNQLPISSMIRGKHTATTPSSTGRGADEGIDFNVHQRRSHSPRSNLLATSSIQSWSPSFYRRPRANTTHHSKPGLLVHRQRIPRNRSVPEKLHRLHHTEGNNSMPSQSEGIILSASGTNLALPRRPVNIRRNRTVSPSPSAHSPSPAPNRSGTS